MVEERFTAVLKVHVRVREFRDRVAREEPLDELYPLLLEVHAAMPAHFAEEDRPGGFFEAIVELGIVGAFSVKHLRRDHAELLAEAADVVTGWKRRSDTENRRRLNHFARELGNHEAVESHYADVIEAE